MAGKVFLRTAEKSDNAQKRTVSFGDGTGVSGSDPAGHLSVQDAGDHGSFCGISGGGYGWMPLLYARLAPRSSAAFEHCSGSSVPFPGFSVAGMSGVSGGNSDAACMGEELDETSGDDLLPEI